MAKTNHNTQALQQAQAFGRNASIAIAAPCLDQEFMEWATGQQVQLVKLLKAWNKGHTLAAIER